MTGCSTTTIEFLRVGIPMAKWDHLVEIAQVKHPTKEVTVMLGINIGLFGSSNAMGILRRAGLDGGDSVIRLLRQLNIHPFSMDSGFNFMTGPTYSWHANSRSDGKKQVDKIFKYVTSVMHHNPTVQEMDDVPIQIFAYQGNDPFHPIWQYRRDYEADD